MHGRLVLYVGEKNVSSWSMRAWIACTFKGVPFEERAVSVIGAGDRFLDRVSPTGRVPVLHHGELAIPDSLAIVEYLEETFPPPEHPALWPGDRARRARARWLAACMHSGFPLVREHLSFNWCFLPTRPPVPPEAMEEARDMARLWETSLAECAAHSPFLAGPFSGADVLFAPAVWRLTAFAVPVSPRVGEYMTSVLAHPAVSPWMDAARRLEPIENE